MTMATILNFMGLTKAGNLLLLVILSWCAVPNGSQTQGALSPASLKVVLTGFRNNKRHASVTLFNNERAFPKSPEKSLRTVYVTVNNNKAMAVFENLQPGEYAISVYHDENNNQNMDTNFLGIPKEGVGASNNAKGHFGPPEYKDAKFYYNGNNQVIKITIMYI